jgi:hypothetical protein
MSKAQEKRQEFAQELVKALLSAENNGYRGRDAIIYISGYLDTYDAKLAEEIYEIGVQL